MKRHDDKEITAQNLGEMLLRNNTSMTRGEFFHWLSPILSSKGSGIRCGDVAIPEGLGEKHYPVVMTDAAAVPEHGLTIDEMFGAALHVLEGPLIGAIIAENKVAWNDVDLDTVPNNGSGALFSVVINKKCKFTAIYESGPDYIRIASITGKTDDSIINPRYFIIEVDEYGAISCPSMVADDPSLQDKLAEMEADKSEN
mgnify:FL=1